MLRAVAARLLSQATRQAASTTARGALAAVPLAPQPPLPWRQQQLWGLPSSWLQRAGVRTRHAAKPHSRTRRGWLRRAARAAGAATGLALVGLPLAGIGALVVRGRDDADAIEIIRSLPRTLRVVWWGSWAAYQYKALASRYSADAGGEAHRQALAALEEHAAHKLLLAIQANGGLYIKAGQLAVSLNAVPPQYRTVLESLQDRVPPRPFEDAEAVLLQELGAPAAQLFAQFQQLATAAASLAQVHRARLHDGMEVAVKVQYPGLQSAVAADLATMLALADAGHWLFPTSSWRWLFEELQRQLHFELDFRHEASNAARLAACMAGRPDVAVPRMVPQLCTARVLTMEWVEGCKLTDVDCQAEQGLRPRDVGVLLLDVFAQQTYQEGFTHGDPHPGKRAPAAGNILVRPRPDPPPLLSRLLLGSQPRPQLLLLDHGVYVTLPDRLRRPFCQLWGALVLGDMDTARLAATELAGDKGGRILPEILRPRNWAKVSKEERQRVRREAGITSFADLAAVLTEAPKPLLDSLRQSAVVRHSATLLGATLGDRLRINATWALRGMYRGARSASGQLQFVGHLQSRISRWRLAWRVGLMRVAFWLTDMMQDFSSAVRATLT